MKKYPFIISDFDGTLFRSDHTIDKETIKTIQKFVNAGGIFVISSGRPLQSVLKIAKELGLKGLVAAFNGAVIYNAEQANVEKTACEAVNPADLVQDLFAFGCSHAHVNSDRYYLVRKERAERKAGEYTLQDVTFPTLIYQVSVELPTETESARVAARVEEKYGHLLSALQNGRCVDIVAKGVGKAYGLKKVQAQFNARWEDVITVGDNLNDVDMLQAFTSYAMENGVEEVKKIATHTTKSVTDVIYRELNGKNE